MLDDSLRVKIVRNAIASPEGWVNLVESILSEEDSDAAKRECHRMFKIIAEDSYNPGEWFEILTYELDRHIEEVKARYSRIKVGEPNLKTKIG